jgi:hypothetical protein
MKALTVVPLHEAADSLSDMPEPPESDGPILVERLGDMKVVIEVNPG